MTCEEAERSIPWFLDDELEASLALEIEAHVAQCASCRAALEREGRLRLTLRRATQSISAPAALRRRVQEAIAREQQARSRLRRAWPIVASIAVLMAFAWNGTMLGAGGESDAIAERRARDLPMDVVSADIGQVQNYFQGKLPFAVRLPHLKTAVGSLGGRVTNVADREAAYVRYDTPRGRVSVFVYEDGAGDFSEVAPMYLIGQQRMSVRQVRGYTVAKWRSAGLTYAIVTEIPAQEFSSVLRASLDW